MARSWASYILPAALISGGVAIWLRRERAPIPPSVAPAEPVAAEPTKGIALLDGLGVGDTLEGFRVTKIFLSRSQTDKPQLSVELERGTTGMTIWITRKGNVDNPPYATERYALTYGDARPLGVVIAKEDYDRLLAAIGGRVKKNEAAAPVPDGL